MIGLVGILNVTPDSFSDGGKFISPEAALQKAQQLFDEGAFVVDIGADSSRPGSSCVGPDEEWKRIADILPELLKLGTVSVDTHHAQVAQRAIKAGATFINDVSAGLDLSLLRAIAESDCKIVLMHSVCPTPHSFPYLNGADDRMAGLAPAALIPFLSESLSKLIDRALKARVRHNQIVLDPGMGAFLSADPRVSFDLLSRFHELCSLGYPLMLGCSRKGFLKEQGEKQIEERDNVSALAGFVIAQRSDFKEPAYIRTHNVKLQKSFLSMIEKIS